MSDLILECEVERVRCKMISNPLCGTVGFLKLKVKELVIGVGISDRIVAHRWNC